MEISFVEKEIIDKGYPAYTTSIGWIGYDDETRRGLCRDALKQGYKSFKAKVGDSIENDKHRLTLIREEIGYENKLMVDANQVWEVNEAIDWMKQLANFNLLWIEEPTSPDDVVGHASVAKVNLSINKIRNLLINCFFTTKPTNRL